MPHTRSKFVFLPMIVALMVTHPMATHQVFAATSDFDGKFVDEAAVIHSAQTLIADVLVPGLNKKHWLDVMKAAQTFVNAYLNHPDTLRRHGESTGAEERGLVKRVRGFVYVAAVKRHRQSATKLARLRNTMGTMRLDQLRSLSRLAAPDAVIPSKGFSGLPLSKSFAKKIGSLQADAAAYRDQIVAGTVEGAKRDLAAINGQLDPIEWGRETKPTGFKKTFGHHVKDAATGTVETLHELAAKVDAHLNQLTLLSHLDIPKISILQKAAYRDANLQTKRLKSRIENALRKETQRQRQHGGMTIRSRVRNNGRAQHPKTVLALPPISLRHRSQSHHATTAH